tara:strand:+ start:2369 stop:2710 length:342 start_codon:yes stop_codon:yes gene_type:complete
MRIKILTVISFALFNGCLTSEVAEVILSQNKTSITLENRFENPVFFILMETSFGARVNLSNPCDNFTPNLEPNGVKVIPLQEIAGYSKDAESFWFYWTDCKIAGNSETIKFIK